MKVATVTFVVYGVVLAAFPLANALFIPFGQISPPFSKTLKRSTEFEDAALKALGPDQIFKRLQLTDDAALKALGPDQIFRRLQLTDAIVLESPQSDIMSRHPRKIDESKALTAPRPDSFFK
ncbi:hypothetical protein K435DRAFT_973656 [Dendrothele bispora CBS 962.96]|uniref:Uncharacterized protein n=1 Tax=Dendrothele bispora (strain CBS 962.96) TaxID=1314807 RepID=A0A4S8KR06_DENBC|nr:hypothetical protein K435DRAFT_973656 [Dendrothele bispora CBS 962.96]